MINAHCVHIKGEDHSDLLVLLDQIQKQSSRYKGLPVKTLSIENLVNCARCGKTHQNLVFTPFSRPTPRFSHWCDCPTTNQPILLRIEEVEQPTHPLLGEPD